MTDVELHARPAIPLTEALGRWRREARAGVLDTGRYRCRFFVWGRGTPLVFIHGLADRARSFVPLIAHLTDSFRCIAYELPTGERDRAKPASLRHADLVNDLFDLIDHLDVGQACLYGSSFGSTVALAALHRAPKRFLRAAIQSGFAHRTLAPAEVLMVSLAVHWPGRLGRVPVREQIQKRIDRPQFGDDEAMWRFFRANTATAPLKAVASRALILRRLDLRPLLPLIRHPILLVAGDSDAIVARDCTDELEKGLPHADRIEFPHCGHYPHYTHTAGLAEALRRFLLPPCGL